MSEQKIKEINVTKQYELIVEEIDINEECTIIIKGPMYSGKTSLLIKILNLYKKQKGCKICVIKSTLDDRYSVKYVVNHNGGKVLADLLISPEDNLSKYAKLLNDYDIIFIDEGQFFIGLTELRKLFKGQMVIAGLDYKFDKTSFGEINKLSKTSSLSLSMKGYCHKCKKQEAIYSKRLSDSKKDIEVGNGYVPVCMSC